MSDASKNILVIVGIRVPQANLDGVVRVLQRYVEEHKDSFIDNIQLRPASEETYNVFLPLRCAEGEDSAYWSRDFTTYLSENQVDWSNESTG